MIKYAFNIFFYFFSLLLFLWYITIFINSADAPYTGDEATQQALNLIIDFIYYFYSRSIIINFILSKGKLISFEMFLKRSI